ncbi:MAG: hypothetical protein WA399_12040, partial [Acidobacteriaceae bacterium]
NLLLGRVPQDDLETARSRFTKFSNGLDRHCASIWNRQPDRRQAVFQNTATPIADLSKAVAVNPPVGKSDAYRAGAEARSFL